MSAILTDQVVLACLAQFTCRQAINCSPIHVITYKNLCTGGTFFLTGLPVPVPLACQGHQFHVVSEEPLHWEWKR